MSANGTIASGHARAHAAEGLLFRKVVESAVERHGLLHVLLVEKSALAEAAQSLDLTEAALKRSLLDLGKAAGKPWRADEKMAALAAWVALHVPLRRVAAR